MRQERTESARELYKIEKDQDTRECSKDAVQGQQQRSEPSTITLTWHACKCKVHKLHQRYILVRSFCTLYLHACQVRVNCRRLRPLLLYICYVFQALINSLECWWCPRIVVFRLVYDVSVAGVWQYSSFYEVGLWNSQLSLLQLWATLQYPYYHIDQAALT